MQPFFVNGVHYISGLVTRLTVGWLQKKPQIVPPPQSRFIWVNLTVAV